MRVPFPKTRQARDGKRSQSGPVKRKTPHMRGWGQISLQLAVDQPVSGQADSASPMWRRQPSLCGEIKTLSSMVRFGQVRRLVQTSYVVDRPIDKGNSKQTRTVVIGDDFPLAVHDITAVQAITHSPHPYTNLGGRLSHPKSEFFDRCPFRSVAHCTAWLPLHAAGPSNDKPNKGVFIVRTMFGIA